VCPTYSSALGHISRNFGIPSLHSLYFSPEVGFFLPVFAHLNFVGKLPIFDPLNSTEVRICATVLRRLIFYFVKYLCWFLIAWSDSEIFIRFLSCLGIEPRIFGFKVKTGGQVTKQPTNFNGKILNLSISKIKLKSFFRRTKFGRINLQHRKTANFAGLDDVAAFQRNS
jgi:hypothetical protein